MKKCNACGRFLPANDGVVCGEPFCGKSFHRECVKIPRTAKVSPDWGCPDCKSMKPRDNRPGTPVSGLGRQFVDQSPENTPESRSSCQEPTTETDIKIFMKEMRQFCSEMKSVVLDIKNEIMSLSATVGACNARLDELDNRILSLENAAQGNGGEITKQLQYQVEQLKYELSNREQEHLINDIEITGVPETQSESLIHIVTQIANKVGVTLDDRDVVWAHRAGPRRDRGDARPRPLCVRVSRRALRDQLLKGARVRRGATTADLGLPGEPRAFHINERLTATNRHLFRKTRELARAKNWKFTWTRDGRIYVRQDELKPVHRICSEKDHLRVFESVDI